MGSVFAWFRRGSTQRRSKQNELIRFPDPDALFKEIGEPREPQMSPLKSAPVHHPSCNLCGRQDGFEVLHERIQQIDTPSRVVRCPECSLVFLSPRLGEIGDSWWNAKSYLTDCLLPEISSQERVVEGRMLDLGRNDRHYASVLTAIEHVRRERGPRASLLDAGASLGLLVLAATRAGWRARGLEPSNVVATYGSKVLGVEIDVGTVETLRRRPSEYDCITLTDVLEHTFDPCSTLESLLVALKPGGTLFLSVPNFDATTRIRAGADWPQFVTDHYHHFTGDTLGRLLMKAGYHQIILRVDKPLPFCEIARLDPALLDRTRDRQVSWQTADRTPEALYAWARKPLVDR